MSLRDGGTTYVVVREDDTETCVTIDYSLPWNGRKRKITVSAKPGTGKHKTLRIDSAEEQRLIAGIRAAAEAHLGAATLDGFLESPETNPGEGHWFYVLNFLRIVKQERATI